MKLSIDEVFMSEAVKEATKALDKDEVPVGAVVVHKGRILGRGHNQMRMLKDPTAHAEMIAITAACAKLKSQPQGHLLGCSIYVTIEPCSMCAGAMVLARVKSLVYGAKDPKAGACGSATNIIGNRKLNHKVTVKSGILEKECSGILSEFFKKKRRREN